MKKIIIITIVLCILCIPSFAQYADTGLYHRMNDPVVLYSNLDARIQKLNREQATYSEDHLELVNLIDYRFERMEDKFDTYFMWGYGSLLGIIMGGMLMLFTYTRQKPKKNKKDKIPKKTVFPATLYKTIREELDEDF